MMSTCTAKSDIQVVFALVDKSRYNRENQLVLHCDELISQLTAEDIVFDLFVPAGQLLQARYIVRIWQESDINNNIGLTWNSVLETK